MSDKELEEYINKIEPNFDSHLEKGTIEMSNEYYNLLEEKMVRLINKNQELKQKYLNAVADYETTMSELQELNKQIDELNKQLENTINSYTEEHNMRHNSDLELDILKTQQKEFIKYLEDMLDDENDIFSVVRVKDVLQKYKSIIGVSNEKSNNISS